MTEHPAKPDEQTSEDRKKKWSDLAPDADRRSVPAHPKLADDATSPGSLGGDNGGG